MPDYLAILTRSEEQNQEIIGALRGAVKTLSLPLFCLKPTAEADRAVRELRTAQTGDVIVFVSPWAVLFTKKLITDMPSEVRLTAPGIATLNVIRKEWPGCSCIENTAAVSESGSEVLSEILLQEKPRCVYIVRAQKGRDFLSDKLVAAGIEVRVVEVYLREPARWSASQIDVLKLSMKSDIPVLYMTSSEAVGVLLKEAKQIPGLTQWLRSGHVLTIHPRIEDKLREEYFSQVQIINTKPQNVATQICELCGSATSDVAKIRRKGQKSRKTTD